MRYLLRLLLTIVAAVLYGLGWLAGKVSFVVSWAWSAAMVGWDDARGPVLVNEPLRRVT